MHKEDGEKEDDGYAKIGEGMHSYLRHYYLLGFSSSSQLSST